MTFDQGYRILITSFLLFAKEGILAKCSRPLCFCGCNRYITMQQRQLLANVGAPPFNTNYCTAITNESNSFTWILHEEPFSFSLGSAAVVRGHTATIRRCNTTATVCFLTDPVLMLTVAKNIHSNSDISPPNPTHEPAHMKLSTSTQFVNSLQIITVTAGHLSRMRDATAAAEAPPHLRPLLLSIVGAEWK